MKTIVWLLGLSTVLVSCARDTTEGSAVSGPFSENELAVFVETVRAEYGLPGLGVLIQSGDEEPLVAVTGVRKLGSDALIRSSDMWFIGSTAKSMTATLLAILVQERAVTFDTTLLDVFPEYADEFTETAKQITVSHILSHAAGLPPNPADSPGDLAELLGDTDSAREQRKIVVRQSVSGDLLFTPGTQFAYSNTGYILAGAVIEQITGKDYESLLAERVFKPLGITQFGFGQPGGTSSDQTVDQPWGHRSSFFRMVPVSPDDSQQINPSVFNSAGNLYISLEDWHSYVRDQLNGRKGDGLLFDQAVYETLQMPVGGATGYSKGWGVLVEEGLPVMLTHSGSDGNWYADVRAYPPTDLILLMVTNDGRDEGKAKDAIADIRRTFNRRYAPAP